MKKIFLKPHVILPLSILLGVFAVSVHLADAWDILTSGRLEFQSAQAETPPKEEAKPEAEAKAEPAAENRKDLTLPPDTDASSAELDILKQLSERREQLEQRSRALDTREALLKVTEQRVGQKIKEMEVLKQQVQSLVDQAAGAQQAQLDNLVKIYETMKPDEAAKIFETLDMSILLGVIQRMKPGRTALVMAKMPPEKAKEITIALTKQDRLPEVK
ncbi:MAG: hypothetical protein PHE27_07500 [Alphaproteobacteria bacterium]|nr:hypothetical protein [Alphaproteobacteria bacterium]